MPDSVLVAVISLAGVIVTAVVQNHALSAQFQKQSELADARLEGKVDEYRARTDTKLEDLTREVREHNNFARRLPVLESRVDALEADVRALRAQ